MSEINPISERVKQIISTYYNGNKRLFAKEIQVSPTVIENIVGTRNGSPSFGVLQKIYNSNANISAHWLLTGKGQMLRINNKSYLNEEKATFKDELNCQELELLKKDLEATQSIINDKIEMINVQKDLINNLKEENQRLKGM